VRPQKHETFLRLRSFADEQGQVDWASFGTVTVVIRSLPHARSPRFQI